MLGRIDRTTRSRSIGLYRTALHLPVHVEFQNKLQLVVVVLVVIVVVVVVLYTCWQVFVLARERSRTAAMDFSPLLLFPSAFTAGFPSLRATSVCPFPHRSSPVRFLLPHSYAVCSAIASLLILGHGDINGYRYPRKGKKKQTANAVLRDNEIIHQRYWLIGSMRFAFCCILFHLLYINFV